jgi:phosphoglycerate dehydrogenase-like enzyme
MSTLGVLIASAAVDPSNVERIRRSAPDTDVTVRTCSDPGDVTRALEPHHEVLFTQFLPDSLEHARGLRWVQLLSAGVDHVREAPTWSDPTFVITTSSGIHAPSISEYVMGTILYRTQRLALADRYRASRTWDERPESEPLVGRTMVILGYGSLGRRIARVAAAYGMKVIAVRRDPADTEALRFQWLSLNATTAPATEVVGPSELHRVLRECDFLVVAVPLTPETVGLLGEAELALLRPTSMIVNVSRGRVIDEAALTRALTEGRLAFAALDVFASEPLGRTSPLFDLPNVLLTPHVSGHFAGYVARATDLFIENLARYRRGDALLNVVDRQREY